MKIIQLARADLLVFYVEHHDLEDAVKKATDHVRAHGVTSDAAFNPDTDELLVFAKDGNAWAHALVRFGVSILETGRADDGVYGSVDLTESFRGDGNVYWIERVSPPCGDLLDGPPESEPIYQVSHANPVGELETEPVRAETPLLAAEKYMMLVFEKYGTAHHLHGNGYLTVQVTCENGSTSPFDVFRDGTIDLSVKTA